MSRRTIPLRTMAACALAAALGVLAIRAGGRAQDEGREPERPHAANRLADETSPYLLLHAHNPVAWYPWGPEAFAKARAEDKPIFLSIGYSSCFWCHVMERECFEDPEIARLMNEEFVNIKVDREERPDVDQIYMTALQAFGTGGGWPLSMFLTPEGKPFYGGTYFPPETRDGMPSFPTVLNGVADAWRDERAEVDRAADQLADLVRRATEAAGLRMRVPLRSEMVRAGVAALADQFDPEYGGFGFSPVEPRRPKFPEPANLLFLLDRHRREAGNPVARRIGERAEAEAEGRGQRAEAGAEGGEQRADETAGGGGRRAEEPAGVRGPSAPDMVTTTLDHLARGGIRDHLGGGYHRYSTERTWTVPHFEKMLYDNALLASTFLGAHELTGDDRWRREAEDIFAFVAREMTDPEHGGFYSALGAETDGEEGAYYVWTREEVEGTLGDGPDTLLFLKSYGLSGEPNFEGVRYVLRRPTPEAAQAEALKLTPEELEARLAPLRATLLEARDRRERPLLDDKVLTAWNGLMIAAYADGFRVLGEDAYRRAAERAAEFVWAALRDEDGRLLRTYRADEAKLGGYLEDYACYALGLLRLHEATDEARWLDRARQVADRMIADFADEANGGFFFTADDHESLLARPKDPYDGATPSGNGVAVRVLLGLAEATGEARYREAAGEALDAFSLAMDRTPGGVPTLLAGLAAYLDADGPTTTADGGPTDPADPPGIGNAGGVVNASVALREGDVPGPDATIRIDVTLEIAEGWHVGANPAGNELAVPTTLALAPDDPALVEEVAYPEGEPFSVGGDAPLTMSTYGGGTTIPVIVHLAEDLKPGPLEMTLRLRYQACNDRVCHPPATLEIPVRLEVPEP